MNMLRERMRGMFKENKKLRRKLMYFLKILAISYSRLRPKLGEMGLT